MSNIKKIKGETERGRQEMKIITSSDSIRVSSSFGSAGLCFGRCGIDSFLFPVQGNSSRVRSRYHTYNDAELSEGDNK